MTTRYAESRLEGFRVLGITGQLDSKECANFRVATHDLSAESTIVNLLGIDYLDAPGLGCLLVFEEELRLGHGKRVVFVVNETVSNILALTKLNRVFVTAESIEEAVRILRE